jgi:predicted dehydrogenase
MAMAAIKAGKHVFVEKPMALTAADGRKLVEAARKAGVNLMVGYTLRFMPERILMKKLLDSGAIGEVVHIIGGQMIGNMGGWLGTLEHGGGPLFYIGSHVTDNVLWVAGGMVERVLAEEKRPDRNGLEKSIFMTLRFADGAIAQVSTSQQLGCRYGWLDVLGTAGRMRVEWESNNLLIQSAKIEAYRELTSIRVPPTAHMPKFASDARMSFAGSAYIRVWAAEFVEFITAIKENRDPSVTGEDGVRVLEVIDAAFESARTGKPVDTE